jgi:hypothetical protein
MYDVPDPDHEPARVLISRGSFIDESRDGREVPYKIYYPAEDLEQSYPVVLWSHGLGGSRDGAAFLSRYIASHAHIVINLTHKGTDTSLWEGKEGHPWDVIRATHIPRHATLNRFKDIPFFINQLESSKAQELPVYKNMDLSSLGMSGHSFGAITTQVMAGQMLGRGKRRYNMADKRIKAGIAYSMSPTYNHEPPYEHVYGSINIPMMYMTGTEDSSPVAGHDYKYRLPIFEHPKGADQHLLVLEGGDHMVFAGSRGKLGQSNLRKQHEDIIKIVSLAFWRAYLRGDMQAKEWLTGSGIEDYLQGQAQHVHRP